MKISRGTCVDNSGGGKRGKILTFSAAARRRMMYKVNQISRSQLPVFVTLTYPDEFPRDPERWSRDVDAFRKWFTRMGWAAVWKKELKPRQSGKNQGEIAPHFHMLVWGASFLDLATYVPRAWYRIVGSNNPDHLAHGADVEQIKSPNGVKSYISKYMCKDDEAVIETGQGRGRFWGVINAKKIPWVEPVEIELTRDEVNNLFRSMRRFMRMGRRHKMQLPGLTMICDADFWFDRLEGLTRPVRGAQPPTAAQIRYQNWLHERGASKP
jgi:hypothetical protein